VDGPQRIRLTVRYDGTDFAGSQVQPARKDRDGKLRPPARTVSGTLTNGLEALLGQPVKLLWASRTDSGVHADGNVCAFDLLPGGLPPERLVVTLNRRLPADLRVDEAQPVAATWHPRYAASAREYEYCVWRGAAVPYDHLRFSAAYDGAWDTAAVDAVRKAFVGRHDFRVFARDAGRVNSTVCELTVCEQRLTGSEIRWRIRANRFLRRMVCNLAGTLLAAAAGKVVPDEVRAALAGTQSFKVVAAPPRGLVLMKVIYPPA
jgi:tRNA pseudouridine38-40 synthase